MVLAILKGPTAFSQRFPVVRDNVTNLAFWLHHECAKAQKCAIFLTIMAMPF